jgi:uncharacterized protein (TIGR02246 family)
MPGLLEEKDAIRDVLSEYCFCLDGGLHEEMAMLFTPDGVWETAFGSGRGRNGIRELLSRIGRPGGVEPRSVHVVGNVVIKIDGDRATVRSNWLEPQNSRRGPVIEAAGAYYDVMVKIDGKWLFEHRRIDRFIADTRGPAHSG